MDDAGKVDASTGKVNNKDIITATAIVTKKEEHERKGTKIPVIIFKMKKKH